MKSKSNRLPFVIAGILGCLAICLLIALFAGLFFIFGSRQTSTVSQPVSQATPGLTQPVVIPTPSLALTPTSQPIVFPTGSPLNKAAANLTGLSSYQASLRLKAKGTHRGQPFEWTYAITRVLSSDPALEVAKVDTTGLGQVEDYSGTVWIRSGKQFLARRSSKDPCTFMSQGQAAGLRLAPGVLLPNLGNAQKIGNDQVAGVAAERYEVSSKDTGVTGKVWLATQGGLVIQASLKQDGALLSLGADAKGHAEWEYTLSSINKPVALDLPLSCRHLLGDLPLPADASSLSATDDLMRYTTSTTLSDLGNFYADKMKQAGWESLGTPTITKDEARMAFARKDETVFVGAILLDNKTDVTIIYQGQ